MRSLLLALLVAGPVSAQDLLANPGFETGDFAGWTVTAGSTYYGLPRLGVAPAGTTEQTYFGTGIVSVHGGNLAGFAVVNEDRWAILSQTVPVRPGTLYSAGFYTQYSPQVASVGIAVAVDGVRIAEAQTASASAFTLTSGLFCTGPGQTAATVQFIVNGSGSGTILISFDDAFLVETSPQLIIQAAIDYADSLGVSSLNGVLSQAISDLDRGNLLAGSALIDAAIYEIQGLVVSNRLSAAAGQVLIGELRTAEGCP